MSPGIPRSISTKPAAICSARRHQPWFKDYLHPTLAKYFEPNPANHGSYFIGWSSTDEMFWKENYRIGMAALREFEKRGGLIGTGDDAGFIYQMYGFGLIRELELHQEAGFQPLIVQHATANNARILGQEETHGPRSRGIFRRPDRGQRQSARESQGALSDRHRRIRDGKLVHTGGVEWTIKDGIPYHAPA